MDTHNPTPPNDERPSSSVLPQWDIPRRHRLRLDERVRSVRRWLIAGGIIGTVAFSAVAGYGTKVASSTSAATKPATAATAAVRQTATTGFFAGQSSTVAASPTPQASGSTASATSVATTRTS